ncbi:MAG: hypothetical protein GY910_24090 [bacterium]|nr:hypothetical protein [bacterium]
MRDSAHSQRIEELFGIVEWRRATGLLHVAAIAGSPPRAIAIGPDAPASPTDRFVLGFARARADAIVTTGAILRAEPDLVHCYAEEVEENATFARWRSRVLGKSGPPALIVLSASGAFATDHPALAAVEDIIVWTTSEGRARLAEGGATALLIEASAACGECLRTSVHAAIERVRSCLNAGTILIEAGPTISSTLYPDPRGDDSHRVAARWIDELLLSRFEAELEPRASGPVFVPKVRVTARFGGALSATRIDEASGPWSFERYRVES